MEEERLTFVDLDNSFTSTASTSSFTTTTTSSSARSSLSLSLPSFTSASLIPPLPHSACSDPRWSALRAAAALSPDQSLHLRHLQILRPLGSGHLARVFHCRLRNSPNLDFALKVVDLDAAPKLPHVQTEARVLAALDHPFLPTLYARLDASHYVCFLIDYCPDGDLHSLLRRRRRLPIASARFYAAEILLALQYLHALGFVYRDLKPENVLVRADGHVMLSDFDLCFHSDPNPQLLTRTSPNTTSNCFRTTQNQTTEFVSEPTSAHSRACVGTHEYLAPEVVNGGGHGSAVDWWAFGVFIYELIYGRTPFKGATKDETLRNIAGSRELRFPEGRGSAAARDLISRLLVRDPKRRMGAAEGAAEIMRHQFFEGVRWPLIRWLPPPAEVAPGRRRRRSKWNGWEIIRKMGIKRRD